MWYILSMCRDYGYPAIKMSIENCLKHIFESIYMYVYIQIYVVRKQQLCLIYKLIKMYNIMCNNYWSTTMKTKGIYLYLSYSINLLALELKYVLPICNH